MEKGTISTIFKKKYFLVPHRSESVNFSWETNLDRKRMFASRVYFEAKCRNEYCHCPLTTVTAHLPPYTAHCFLSTGHCLLSTVYCSLPTADSTLPTVYCTLHTAHCSMSSVQCPLSYAHFPLHSDHCPLTTVHFACCICCIFGSISF
jgi:hypothetical protein